VNFIANLFLFLILTFHFKKLNMFQISLYLPRIKVKINSCFGVDHKEQNVAKAYLILLQFKHADPHIPKILHLFFAQWGAKMIRLGYRLDNQLLIV